MIRQLRRLFGQSTGAGQKSRSASRLNHAKATALEPQLYADWGVPDTFDGRFEALLLVVATDYARLVREDQKDEADALLSAFMQDVELALQASGVSEAGMRKKVRAVEISSFARVENIGKCLRNDQSCVPEILSSMFGAEETPSEASRTAAAQLDKLLADRYAAD